MTASQDVFQQAMNQGHSAAWDQMWDQAAGFYRQALDEFPDHPQALSNLGLALFELQEYSRALQCYQRSARLTPGDPLPVEKAAQLFERLGKLEQAAQAALHAAELYIKNREVSKALENWTRVTQLTPENILAHTRLATVYERMGEKEKSAEEYLALAALFQAGGTFERAGQAIRQAYLLAPHKVEVQHAIALLRERRSLPRPERTHGSTAPLRMAQVRRLAGAEDGQENPLDPPGEACQQALTVLAQMLFEIQDEPGEPAPRRGFQSVLRGRAGAPKATDRARVLLHLSQVIDLQTRGENRQAAAELEKAVEAGLEDPAACFDLGYLQVDIGHAERALPMLQKAVLNPGYDLASHLLMAQAYRQLDRTREAALEYLEALKLADVCVVGAQGADSITQLYEPLIEAFRQESDPATQQRLCDNVAALLQHPDWRAQMQRARSQMPGKAPDKALPAGLQAQQIPLAEMMVQARSSRVVEYLTQVYSLIERGNLRAAMDEAFYALQFAPTYLPLHITMGELLIRQGFVAEAVEKFLVVARAYTMRGEPRQAIELYNRVLNLAPMDFTARRLLIEQLAGLGRMDEAVQEYLQLGNIYYQLADLEMSRKTYAEALRLAQQSRVDRAWRVKILHAMADIGMQSLDWRQAVRIYEQIRTIQPDDEPARSQLIDLNLRLNQPDQAITELDSYLAYLLPAGKGEKALAFLAGLVDEHPGQNELRRRMGELQRQLGRASPVSAAA